ncbi:hypothetical protein J1G36_11820 [Pseudomonas carnis]|uniref:hypothetical protein n=1 Tax=Pseudomonas TaxID=286 RepID=UPI000F5886E5|nr:MULTISPECIES: hypothetical protein [Pseudomonas]MBY8952582.1 hypothetical protein [Pseudomonas carnis]
MRFFVLVMAAALLSGCATSPAPSDKVRSDASGRVSGYQKQVPDDSSLIVTSDIGTLGGSCFATIFLNGMPVAKLDTGDKVVLQVPSGEWLLGAALDGAARCAANPERIETSVVLKQGQQKKFRVLLPVAGGSLAVQQSSF